MKSATFKNTGTIDTGDDKDISVNIDSGNSSDDAIGSGVNIDVKELNVKGTIGSNAKIKATDLNVGEQTHRNSELEAVEHAEVHLHRGKLKAKTAKINILENGTVEADDVYVGKMLGGEIIGHNVIVEELTSNTKITASESIEVHKISGDHNKLIINPDKIKSYHDKVEKLKNELKIKKDELKKSEQDYKIKATQHTGKLDRIKVFQKRVLKATKSGEEPKKADIINIKQYKKEALVLQEKSQQLKDAQESMNSIDDELHKLYEAELHAKIIHKENYDGGTQVIFVDVETSNEYKISPDGLYEKLFLQKDGDDKKISW